MTRRTRVSRNIVFITVITLLASVFPATAAITLVPVVTSGLASPIYVTHARDGSDRLFIVEQGGVIKVLQPGSSTPTVFLDINTKVHCCGEQGLLGLTFHPQYPTNGRFFVHYTSEPGDANVIAEYRVTADPDVADPDSETIFLVIGQPFGNHNGGMIEFGPDGFLYIAKGDGGSGNDPGNRAQNINLLLGKILRIDVDTPNGQVPYSSPPTNPYFGATPGADEIFAIGLRNPFRFSFDRQTGDLYVGDVGQSALEEVDIVTLGSNQGWRIWEGTQCTNIDPPLCNPAGFTFPIVQYSHTGGRCAVLGGYVYRGLQGSLPLGSYVYGELCTGEIFQLLNGASTVALDTAMSIVSFGEDEAGEVYVIGNSAVQRITRVETFSDVPDTHVFFSWIEALFHAGVTTGCAVSPPRYCPDLPVTRGEMAVFLLRGIHGANFVPPAATGTMFADVPRTHLFADFIEQLAREQITGGCSANPPRYCPDAGTTRAEMAVFLERAARGGGFDPPPATGTVFADVPANHLLARWIEQLARDSITGGCSASPPLYCPGGSVTRGQMAVFLVRTFDLPL